MKPVMSCRMQMLSSIHVILKGHIRSESLRVLVWHLSLRSALLGEVPEDLFELVAIGTVADLSSASWMKIDILSKKALGGCAISKRPAIQALTRIAGTEQQHYQRSQLDS